MKFFFYHSNFCPECGAALRPRLGFGPRYFCDDCKAILGKRNSFKFTGLLFCLTLFAVAITRARVPNSDPTRPDARGNDRASTASVSARDTVVTRPPLPKSAAERVICGARTKKGTPCKHLVPPGQRCPQHRGMASMVDPASGLDPASGAGAPPKSSKAGP